ncbi:MAG: TRAP transporter substrate-binding protein DctP [Clostridiales Family XIII bacterium]|nr:TRAP transporter substrate-binding protein DctP [Clostridiales Family XIII bacterium]
MKKHILTVLFVLAISSALIFAGCGSNDAPAASPPADSGSSSSDADADAAAPADAAGLEDWDGIKLTVVTFYGPSHRAIDVIQPWLDEVKSQSGGKIDYEFYPGEELVKNAEMYSALQDGVCDVLFSDAAYNPDAFPLLRGFSLPGLPMPNSVVSTYVANDYWKYAEEQGWAETQSFKFLWAIGFTPAAFESNKKIEKIEDFSGMQIRANGFNVDPVKALGAAPVALPAPEVYEGLMKGTVDASLMQYDALVNWKLAEVAKYGIWAPVVANTNSYGIMNINTWNSLPPAAQELIMKISDNSAVEAAPLFDVMGEEGVAFAEEQGVEFSTLDDATLDAMRAKLAPVADKWLSDVNGSGLPGDDAFAKLKELTEKYSGLYGE